MKNSERGMSIVEIILAVAVFSIMIFWAVRYQGTLTETLRRFQVRRAMTTDARTTMDTIVRLLRSANASTIVIDTPPSTGGLMSAPNSRIQFQTTAGILHRIFWSADPFGCVFLQRNNDRPQKLGESITSIIFSADYRDLSLIDVFIRMDANYDSGANDDRRTTFAVIRHTVRVGETQ